MVLFAIISGLIAIFFSGYLVYKILQLEGGTPRMEEIASAIREGAMAYLNRQYTTIAVFTVIIAVALYYFLGWVASVSFILGAFLSALAGYIGMNVSVRTNVKTAQAAKKGLKEALTVAFKGGTVTGMMVVGLGLLGVTLLYSYYGNPELIIGFGFGASLISLFARVGGGIYTKAADVGADLVGKVEKGIPEDDPRNPAVIADNVGDNVGDCAGMAADLFESYVVTLIAAMLLGLAWGNNGVLFPILMGAVVIIMSIIGTYFVKLDKSKNIWKALYKSVLVTTVLSAIAFFILSYWLFSTVMIAVAPGFSTLPVPLNLFLATLTGLATGLLIGYITEYYTSREGKHVRRIAEAAKTGAGTNIITGLAVGFQSTALPVLVIVTAIFLSYYFAGVYGIAIAAMAMLSLTGVIVSIDSYGPITDNAGGIAEMSGLEKKVRNVTDALDAVGNTTKAVTKGFAIGSAALAALSLFVAFADATGLTIINILNARVVVGLFIGGALPFLFSSFLMQAVGKAAFEIVEEVRRQFRTMKGIMEGKQKPNYARAVDISTRAALKELVVPGLLAVVTPLAVGFILGTEALAGLLTGSIVTGLLLALMMANAGAAWDNAKKYIEAGALGGKGSDAHKASVVGDTVGDPFKDTAGPSLNPLIKVINTISLLFASLFIFTLL